MKPVLIATALVAAAAATSAAVAKRTPASAPAAAPIVKDGVEISILPRIGAGGGPAGVTEVALDLEAKTADAVTRLGFQSLRAVADVDCGRAANRFISAVAYRQPALAGPGVTRNITGQWVQPASDSYMAEVIVRVCAAQGPAPAAHALPVVREMVDAPPPAPTPQPAAQPAPTPAAAPHVAAAAPPPTPPQVVKFEGPRPVVPPPPPAPAEAASAPPAAPAPSGPLVVKMGAPAPGAAMAPRATTTPAAASFLPKVAGDRVAQVAASANLHDAEKVLRELKPLVAAPLTTTIEQAVVAGAHVYRADVVGFGTAAEAKSFCRAAAHVSKTCWVRAKGDAAAPAKPANPPERLRPAKRAG